MRTRGLAFVAVASITAVASVLFNSPASGGVATTTRVDSTYSTATNYVVSFTGGTAAVEAGITAAGGTVIDINAELGVAKATSTTDGFLTSVRQQIGVDGAARNHSVGIERPGMPHRFEQERVSGDDAVVGGAAGDKNRHGRNNSEPLADRQWDMDMIGAADAQRVATGRGVDIGIIDTGIDASHPDIAPNFDAARSRNFTTDIPEIDGPCEVPSCVDPATVDDGGHGTHVAGIIAAADNNFGISGVAPNARLVNLRAGQDSGFFFLYETVNALAAAGDFRLDVVNMSFYTDPWLYNCASRADYISGDVTEEQISEQALIRKILLKAVAYAHNRGVTLVAAAGNEHVNLALPTRTDETSPDYPLETALPRIVTDNCLNLPAEAPHVISVTSVGPSSTKSDFSSYGLGDVEVAAPGGYFRDLFGTPAFQTPGNLILSSYPMQLAIDEGLANPDGSPSDDFSVRYCNKQGVCGFYTYLQGTSMAAPHVAGVAALIIDRYGRSAKGGGKSLRPATVARILEASATDHACPPGGVQDYTTVGRPADFNAVCSGTTAENGLYGEGIVNAAKAVARGR